jgi:hypothetical protein
MSEENGEDPESGAGVGRTDPATCHGTQNAVGHDLPTTPQVGSASDGGEFSSSNPSDGEGGDGNTRAEDSPSERDSAASGNSVPEVEPTDHAQLAAENIQTQEISNVPMGASMQQGDVGGQGATSAQVGNTVHGRGCHSSKGSSTNYISR